MRRRGVKASWASVLKNWGVSMGLGVEGKGIPLMVGEGEGGRRLGAGEGSK